ncbi:MAG: hypothetical protein R3182_03790, partial [Draconibacterium sp.]|nr:hypothetical protein [Draconibacterium sp.]
ALRHGLRPLKNKGILKIEIQQVKKKTIITIEDNGIGRRNAIGLNSVGAGMGLKAINQIIELNNLGNHSKIGNGAKNGWWKWLKFFVKYECKPEEEPGTAEEQPVSNRVYQME